MTTKEKVKALWNLCFDDSNAFVDMYFKMRYKKEINIDIKSGDEIISAMQMIPYPMTFCGSTIPTSYVSGACTHPDYRGKGVMKVLLAQAFTQMYRGGVLISTLIPAEPWLFNYYTLTGYASVFQYSTKRLMLPESETSDDTITITKETEPLKKVYQYLNRKLSERPCCIQHTFDDFKVIMADLNLGNGILAVSWQKKQVNGVAIASINNKQLIINELFAESKEAENALLNFLKVETNCEKMILLAPATKQSHKPLGMARIINVKDVLQIYATAFPTEDLQIELSDKQLSVNTGYYYLNGGKCMYSSERLPGAHKQMNIDDLTAYVFSKLTPYMSLMLN